MLDLILFLLIITLTAIFIYVVAPILNRAITKTDIDKILIIINRVILYIKQTSPDLADTEQKRLTIQHTIAILQHLDIVIDRSIIEVFVESEYYLINTNKFNQQLNE
ncbi:hypothetical protein SAMN05660297_00393 [Natronincola peptidivorans]|uniref:Bacteriophage holin of superfamily 6 (Holin_LLH) n=1 Tax=Natronincola peptidivorans TaxID=426128 RepID=A0A1H9YT20_9FIRM|nr:hypothetical protein [Natronincola peptidivorans]SES72312.1 hypothetical protein SAMN05660297_00393 [Natronincola peptidivorans]